MKLPIQILMACCFLVSGCEQGGTGAPVVATRVDNISRIDYVAFFQKKPPWQHQELEVSRALKEAMVLAEQHFRSVEPELLISGNRVYRDAERDFVYLTFDHAIPAANASDPVPPPSQTDFFLVYIYKPAEKRFLGYAQHPGG